MDRASIAEIKMMLDLCIPITFIAFRGATSQPYKNSAYLCVTRHKLSRTSFFLFVIFYLSFVLWFFFLFASLHSFINLSSIFSSFITYFCPYSLPPFFHSFQFCPIILVPRADCRNCIFLILLSLKFWRPVVCYRVQIYDKLLAFTFEFPQELSKCVIWLKRGQCRFIMVRSRARISFRSNILRSLVVCPPLQTTSQILP
jgi:hypothetical protein